MSASNPKYTLLYWPSIPGRGEFIRLLFAATRTPYADPANESKEGINEVLAIKDENSTGDEHGNPPCFAPPALRIEGEGPDGAPLLLYQTPTILSYLASHHSFDGNGTPAQRAHVLSHALTALDLNNETHDTHHPTSVSSYYEDQKEHALARSKDFRENRMPKFFAFFERVLQGNKEKGGGQGRYLVGGRLTYADTTLWHVLDGLKFAFPREMATREGDYPLLFGTFYPSVKEEDGVKEYLASEKRLKYSMGVFRHYPELDRQ